ncbi:hypothetical protein BH23BAC4_BH23BAC4_16440 [soil metagenome]
MSENPPRKSAAYIEAMIREAVAHVESCIHSPLREAGFDGPATTLVLSDTQHDFLAGYIYGALRRLLELGEIDEATDVERAAYRLYEQIVGRGETEVHPWHVWVVNEGLKQLNRPHVFLGFCAGRNDIVQRLRRSNFRSALGPALLNLAGHNGSLP